MPIPWAAIIGVAMSLIELIISDKKRRDALKLQMFEFAKKHDQDAIQGNAKLRDEYERMMREVERTG